MTFLQLIKDSLNPTNGLSSAKRVTLLLSQISIYVESFIVMIFYIIIPFYTGIKISDAQLIAIVPVIVTVFTSHLLIVLWALKGISNVDIAYAKVIQQIKVDPGSAIVTDGDQTIVKADELTANNIENVTTQNLNTNGQEPNNSISE